MLKCRDLNQNKKISNSKCKCHKNCGFLSAPIIPTFFSIVCFALFIHFIHKNRHLHSHTSGDFIRESEMERVGQALGVGRFDVLCFFFFRVFWNFSTVTYRRENKFDRNSFFHSSYFFSFLKEENFRFLISNKNCCLYSQ